MLEAIIAANIEERGSIDSITQPPRIESMKARPMRP